MKDAAQEWKLSPQNECYVCQKYKYTMVFYNKSAMYPNKGLTEIKDKTFLR